MKTLFSFILVFSIVTICYAQDDEDFTDSKTTFGLKVGLNSMHMKNVSQTSDNIRKTSGFFAGAFVNIPTSDTFSVQPEVIYSSTQFLGNDNLALLHVPVLLKFNLSDKFIGYAGPEAQSVINVGDQDKDLFNTLLFGFTFGVTYEVAPNFFLEVRPYFALSRFLEDNGSYRKFNTLQVGIGYEFF